MDNDQHGHPAGHSAGPPPKDPSPAGPPPNPSLASPPPDHPPAKASSVEASSVEASSVEASSVEASSVETRLKGHVGYLTNKEESAFDEFKKLATKQGFYTPATNDKKASHDNGTLVYVFATFLLLRSVISLLHC